MTLCYKAESGSCSVLQGNNPRKPTAFIRLDERLPPS